jgi:hypothetical protein
MRARGGVLCTLCIGYCINPAVGFRVAQLAFVLLSSPTMRTLGVYCVLCIVMSLAIGFRIAQLSFVLW